MQNLHKGHLMEALKLSIVEIICVCVAVLAPVLAPQTEVRTTAIFLPLSRLK